jgi:hypothetical protein
MDNIPRVDSLSWFWVDLHFIIFKAENFHFADGVELGTFTINLGSLNTYFSLEYNLLNLINLIILKTGLFLKSTELYKTHF